MRFAAFIPCMNEWRFVPAVAGPLLTVCDRVVVLRSPHTHSGKETVDLTPRPPALDKQVEVVVGDWRSEEEMRNAGMQMFDEQGFDWVFSLDSDEIMTENVLKFMVKIVSEKPDEFQTLATRLFTYWKTPDFVIEPVEDLIAPFLFRHDVRFKHIRIPVVGTKITVIPKPLIHHLSYVRTDEEVIKKLQYFCHAHEVDSNWYSKVWKAWDDNHALENLNPMKPDAYKHAIPCSGDVRKILDQYGIAWPRLGSS